ncbi:MAG: hypothetical protein II588_05075 [Paludibacteraceae bacterium]|nr:hypothetical protein [Paludibacteraceae bacterium]
MKKTLFLAALVLMSACVSAQQANLKAAKSLTGKKDYAGARAAIDQALNNDETKNLPMAWYLAGEIGYRQLKAETDKQYEDPMYQVNYAEVGAAVYESCEYWIVADSLAMVPMLDKKGREVPTDPKTRKNIQAKMLQYYQNKYLVQYGAAMQGNNDMKSAYNAFRMHTLIPTLPMMDDPKIQAKMPRDEEYQEYMYYAVNFAFASELYPEAIEMMQKMLAIENVYKEKRVNELLFEGYKAINDSLGMEQALQRGVAHFPEEPWFIQNMINFYVYSNQQQKAIDYLDQAIERDPGSAQYYVAKASMLESMSRYTDATTLYEKAIELNPEYGQAYAGLGRIKYNQAVIFDNGIPASLRGKALDDAEKTKNAMYHAPIEYFEKAIEYSPEDIGTMNQVKSLYYRFRKEPGMQAKYDAMMKKIKEAQNK